MRSSHLLKELTWNLNQNCLPLGLRLFFFLFLFFLGLHPWHIEVPRLEVELVLQLPAQPQPQQRWIQTMSVTYAAACNNTRSFTHRWSPGIEPISLRTLCQVLNPLSHNGYSSISYTQKLKKYINCNCVHSSKDLNFLHNQNLRKQKQWQNMYWN